VAAVGGAPAVRTAAGGGAAGEALVGHDALAVGEDGGHDDLGVGLGRSDYSSGFLSAHPSASLSSLSTGAVTPARRRLSADDYRLIGKHRLMTTGDIHQYIQLRRQLKAWSDSWKEAHGTVAPPSLSDVREDAPPSVYAQFCEYLALRARMRGLAKEVFGAEVDDVEGMQRTANEGETILHALKAGARVSSAGGGGSPAVGTGRRAERLRRAPRQLRVVWLGGSAGADPSGVWGTTAVGPLRYSVGRLVSLLGGTGSGGCMLRVGRSACLLDSVYIPALLLLTSSAVAPRRSAAHCVRATTARACHPTKKNKSRCSKLLRASRHTKRSGSVAAATPLAVTTPAAPTHPPEQDGEPRRSNGTTRAADVANDSPGRCRRAPRYARLRSRFFRLRTLCLFIFSRRFFLVLLACRSCTPRSPAAPSSPRGGRRPIKPAPPSVASSAPPRPGSTGAIRRAAAAVAARRKRAAAASLPRGPPQETSHARTSASAAVASSRGSQAA